MVRRRSSGGVSHGIRAVFILGLFSAVVLAGCVPSTGSSGPDVARDSSLPMRWDHRPEAAEWTSATLIAVSTKDPVLAATVPADIAAWCPAYPKAGIAERRAFWAGLLSAMAKYESSWNPLAAGGGGRWIGLMQISPRTAANYGCSATSSSALKDGAANLACAVEIMADQVGRDGVVAGGGNRGVGRDWMPLRDGEKRAEMSAWTRAQPYCAGGMAADAAPRPQQP
jgi:Transglycosylase SLT domain